MTQPITTRWLYAITGVDDHEILKRIENVILVIIFTALFCSALPLAYAWKMHDEMADLEKEYVATHVDRAKLIQDGLFVWDKQVYVVGTQAQYPASVSELEKSVKELKAQSAKLEMLLDNALKDIGHQERLINKLIEQAQKEKR